jgi:hypothetical protein
MDEKTFTKLKDELNIEWESRMNRLFPNREVITDGVVNLEKYSRSKFKISWMLKEPYDSYNGTGGGWDYSELFPLDKDLYDNFKLNQPTFYPIIYTTFSIFNDFVEYAEMDWIKDNHDMMRVLYELAFINCQKLPAKGVTVTDFDDLHESIVNNGDLLKKQIKLVDSNILIFGNTFDLYIELLDLENETIINNGSSDYLIKNNRLYISSYHPSQRKIARETYVNDIVNCVKIWQTQTHKQKQNTI